MKATSGAQELIASVALVMKLLGNVACCIIFKCQTACVMSICASTKTSTEGYPLDGRKKNLTVAENYDLIQPERRKRDLPRI